MSKPCRPTSHIVTKHRRVERQSLESAMRLNRLLLIAFALVIGMLPARSGRLRADGGDPPPLAGRVSSVEEGPMEGVLVGAGRAGSTITITVVSNRRGEFRFPPGRLEPGRYTLRIRAVGFELEGPDNVEVAAHRTASADLKLRKTPDLAAQLSNAECIASPPGREQEKAILRPCAHCHTLERIARSHHTADELVAVIQRMATYPQLSFPLKIQKLPAPRIGGGPQSPEQ